MISENTVFILGAGASSVYGFPTGPELTQLIVERLKPGNEGFNTIVRHFSAEELEDFRHALRSSAQTSIDAFLEHRTEFRKVGKAAIADVLIRRENAEALRDVNLLNNWYRYLFSQMNATVDDFARNQVSFLTFNYERSIDEFLFQALKHKYGLTDAVTAQLCSKIPIVHLHGRLGFLPWQDSTLYKRPYTSEIDGQMAIQASELISIVHDSIETTSADWGLAHRLLSKASRIVFLGFGYDQASLRRLNIVELGGIPLFGTTFGMTDPEVRRVNEFLKRSFEPPRDAECFGYLRQSRLFG